MRLKIWIVSLIILLFALSSVVLYNRASFTTVPWNGYRGFSFPTGAVPDGAGGVIVADHAGRRLMRIDRRGTLTWLREGGRRSGGFYIAALLKEDGSGGAWILNTVSDMDSTSFDRVELRRVSGDGGILPPVWQRITSPEEQGLYNRTPYFMLAAGDCVGYLITDADGNTTMHEVSLETGEDRVLRGFPALDAYQFVSAVYDPLRSTGWFMDNNGRVLEWRLDGGDPAPVFTNPPVDGKRIMVPTDLRVIPGQPGFFLLDGKGRVIRIDGDGRPTPVFTPQIARRDLYLTSFLINGTGLFAFSNEARHEVLLWKPAEPDELKALRGGTLSDSQSLLIWAVWLTAALALCVLLTLVMVVYFRVMQRRTPLLVKQLGIFLPLIVGAVLFISLWIYQTMMGRYKARSRNGSWSGASSAPRWPIPRT